VKLFSEAAIAEIRKQQAEWESKERAAALNGRPEEHAAYQAECGIPLQRVYTAGLSRIIIRPVAAYLTFAVVTVAGVAIYPHLGQSLFPGFKERDFLIHWVSPPGTSSAEMERSTTRISNELLAIPGVVGVYVGLLSNEKTPCLKVMLVRKDARLKRSIPRTLEGHPVVTEVTGEIRPLK